MSDVEQGVPAEETVVDAVETQTTEVEATETEAPKTEGQEETAEDLRKKYELAQKKIQRQRKALSALQQDAVRAKHLEAEIAELKKAMPPPTPKIDDFETTDEYLDAKAEYLAEEKARKKLQESLMSQKQALESKTLQEKDKAFQEAEYSYVQANPSYKDAKAEVRNAVQEMGIAPDAPVIRAIYEQADAENNLPQIIDYFGRNGGENLGELEQILSLSPVRAAAEIAKLQIKLGTSPKPKHTPLPPPIKPVSGSARTTKPLSKMSYEELQKAIFKK